MLIWTTRFSKKKAVAAAIAMGVVIAALICILGQRQAKAPSDQQLNTNEDRVAYLQSLGWEIQPEPMETLQFLLPETLEEPYVTYNELQDAQGFDLSSCCGKQVARYTYAVTNYPGRTDDVQVNLYVCEGKPVAGDIFSPGAKGFQATLVYPAQ